MAHHSAGAASRVGGSKRFDSLSEIARALRVFRFERNWAKYHTPKNLSISIAIEASELMEHFQWLSDEEVAEHLADRRDEVAAELADVAIYVLQFADVAGIPLDEAIEMKIRQNAEKYPVAVASGTHAKYTELRHA